MARPLLNPNRSERLAKMAANLGRLLGRHDLTAVRATRTATAGVHLSFDTGVDDLGALCGALEDKELETVDLPSHCADCAQVVRLMDAEHLIKDEDGWTGLYLPRNYRGDRTW